MTCYTRPMLASLFSALSSDPLLGYSLLAAVFLAAVSLGSGWARLDFLAFRPLGLLHLAVAVLLAAGLVVLGHLLDPKLTHGEVGWIKVLAAHQLWPLDGLSRLPLYLVTLGYGPSAGLLAAGLFAAFTAPSGALGWGEAVLALELVVLGWLAILPSPFNKRWAGPLGVLLAYGLAQLTGGLALLEAQTSQATAAALWQRQDALGGILLSVLLLFLLGPASYRQLFRGSRIAPRPKVTAPVGRHDPATLTTFMLPELERPRSGRRRELEPPPEDS